MTLRIGVLGCGSIARAAHLRSLAQNATTTVVAIADTDPGNLSASRSLAPGAQAVADYRAVLTMPDVDAVVIALPPSLHAESARAALEHGKHVYVEKPLATSVADAERVVAAWSSSGLTGLMGFNYRFNPLIVRARERLAAGAVGTPIAVRTVFSTPRRALPAWKQARGSGGGVLLDLAVHHIDLIRFLLDAEIAHVSADLRSVASDDDTAFLQLRLTNDVVAQSTFSLSAVEEDRIEIYGSSGKLSVDRYASLRVDETQTSARGALGLAATRLAAEVRAMPYALQKMRSPLNDPSFSLAMASFVRAVQGGVSAGASLSDGLRVAAVIEAAELSARSGRTTRVDTGASSSEPDAAGQSR